MCLEDSFYQDRILKKIQLPYGNFYFLDCLIVSEVAEGEIFNLEKAKPVMKEAARFFGTEAPLGYVSNRIHDYSLAPQDWMSFFKKKHCLTTIGLVAYSPIGFTNIALERMFIKLEVKSFSDLELALTWTLNRINPLEEQLIAI